MAKKLKNKEFFVDWLSIVTLNNLKNKLIAEVTRDLIRERKCYCKVRFDRQKLSEG